MRMRRLRGLCLSLCAAIFLFACSPVDREAGEGPEDRASEERGAGSEALTVYAVSEPLRSFAERIATPGMSVHFPAPEEIADPAYWNPAPEVVAAYGAADLVLLNGGGYARWVSRASLRERRLVDSSAGFRDRFIPLANEVTHAHGPEGGHSHAGFATTFWLDLRLAREQARAVWDALAEAKPSDAPQLRERHAELDRELESLDARLEELARRLTGTTVFFSHPVYPYFERRYGLRGDAFHWEPDESPAEEDWTKLSGHAGAFMLWEAEPLAATAARLDALGIRVVVFEPAGGRGKGGDFVDRMRANLDRLEARLDDDDMSGAELASVARELRITLAELTGLGGEAKESRLTRMHRESADRKLRLVQGDD